MHSVCAITRILERNPAFRLPLLSLLRDLLGPVVLIDVALDLGTPSSDVYTRPRVAPTARTSMDIWALLVGGMAVSGTTVTVSLLLESRMTSVRAGVAISDGCPLA